MNRPKAAWPIIQSQKLNVGLLSMHYAAACLFIADMIDIGFFQHHLMTVNHVPLWNILSYE